MGAKEKTEKTDEELLAEPRVREIYESFMASGLFTHDYALLYAVQIARGTLYDVVGWPDAFDAVEPRGVGNQRKESDNASR